MLHISNLTGLCLAGGGFAGYFQVGVYQAFHDFGLKFDMVAGTSVGALNGAKIAMGEIEDLKEYWLTVRRRHILGSRIPFRIFFPFRSSSFFSSSKYYQMLKHRGKGLHIKDLELPLFLSATDLQLGKPHVFSEDTLLWKAVAASSAFPGIFPPFRMFINGKERIFIDGGVSNNIPLAPLIENGAIDIYIVLLQPPMGTNQSRFTYVQNLYRSIDILIQNGTMADLRWVESMNKMSESGIINRPPVCLHIIKLRQRPRNPFMVGRKERKKMYDYGYSEASTLLASEQLSDPQA